MSANGPRIARLVSALAAEDEIPQRRQLRRARWAVFVLSMLLYPILIVGGLVDLWWSWRTDAWSAFWSSGAVLAFWSLIPLILIVGLRRSVVPPRALTLLGAQALRSLAAQPDDQLAPPAPEQPTPLDDAHPTSGPQRIGPLASISASRAPSTVLAGLLGVMLVFSVAAVGFAALLNIGAPLSSGPDFSSWLPVGFAIVYGLSALSTLSRLGVWRRMYATVDERGIEWQVGKRRRRAHPPQRIEWDQVRSLACVGTVSYSASSTVTSTAYLLATADSQIVWTSGSLRTRRQKASAASDLLLRVAVSRTGKPLRDISTIASDLARQDGIAIRLLDSLRPSEAPSPALVQGPTAYAPPRRTRPAPIGVAMSLLVALLLIGGLAGAGNWLQSYEPQYYASLQARIVSSTSFFHDDLATPDTDWDVQAPTKDGNGGAAYVGDTYQLSGLLPGYTTWETEPYFFGDGAFAVTASERGTQPAGYTDGVGIALHASSDGLNALMFYVDRGGDWSFWKFHFVDKSGNDNWTSLTSGQSSAIHTDDGDANRLMVVAHGDHYLFYVNSQYVGSYQAAPSDKLPAFGQAGVFLNETSITGIFTQYDIYALPSTAWWEPV
jgi:hypothetical protein